MVIIEVRRWIDGFSGSSIVGDSDQFSDRNECWGYHAGGESSGKIVLSTPEGACGRGGQI